MKIGFVGSFENSVNKQRIIIPAPFKKEFSPSIDNQVVVTLGYESNIVVFPLDAWILLIDKLKNGDKRSQDLMMNLRDFAMPIQTLEGPGRIRLSEELMRYAGINDKDKVVVKGDQNHITVWNAEVFAQKRMNRLMKHQETFSAMDYEL